MKELLKRAVDYGRIGRKTWYVPILCLWPTMMVLAYALMCLTGAPLPDEPRFSMLIVPLLFVVFLVSATVEQLGWQGYAIDRLQDRWNALEAGIIVGLVWAIWHVVPLAEAHRAPTWIAWQCLGMVPFRILIVWIYNNTGRSVFATIVFQATANVSQFSFPNHGSHYDPRVAGLILAFTAAMVVFLWGPQTLARYRFARSRGGGSNEMSKGEGGFLSLALVVRERESRDFAAATPKASAGEQSDDFLSHVFSFRRLSNKREARMSEPMNSHGPLVGRVAVVTGASRRAGIGYALARLAAAPSCTR